MMLLSSLFLLLVASSSVLGQLEGLRDEFEECGRGFQELDLERLGRQSVEVQIDTSCPKLLEVFQCVDGIFEREFSSSLEEMADLFFESVNEEVGRALRVMANTKSMLKDLCTEGTQLYNDVKEDVECFESIGEKEAIDECKAKAAVYEVFTDVSYEIEEVEFEFIADTSCLESAFMVACVSYLVHEKCGLQAFNTFNTILKRTTIFPNMICSKEKLEEMKTSVIDRLSMPKEEKDLFKLALDLKRRK